MTTWAMIRRAGTGVAFALLVLPTPRAAVLAGDLPVWFSRHDRPDGPSDKSDKPTVVQLRTAAENAEKAGDWEVAFAAYCRLYAADRGAPDVREKLNALLRRVQQVRRHRDPQFQQFAANMPSADAAKLFAEVFTKVPVLYVERDRATPQLLWEHAVEELGRALASPAFRQTFLDNPAADKVDGFRQALRTSWAKQPVASAHDAKLQLRKLTAEAQAAFVVRVPSALVIEMVCGACSGLDEYTVFLNPSQFNPDSRSAVPDLSAQGVYLSFADDELVVAGVTPGSWAAYHTGLRKGDRIARLNGRVMSPATPTLAAEALGAPIDGFHEIEVAAEPDSLSLLARLPVAVPTVYGTAVVNSKDGIGYVRVGGIASATPRELDEAIHWLRARGVRAVVLDLRGNLGGSFVAGVETAKRLIPAGVIVTTQGQLSQVDNQSFSSDSGMSAHDLPAVVLVDSDTASAAEVLAAALKDHNRATLIGMPTFGKGAVQYPFRLDSLDDRDDRGRPKSVKTGGVRITIARLLSPRGSPINGVGVSPHVLEADPARQLEMGVEKAIELLPTGPRSVPQMPLMPIMP